MPTHEVFVSYPREHEALVAPTVAILRALDRLIFHDTTSIPPGSLWEEVLTAALQEARLVFVFWCRHALESEWVEREVRTAAELQKTIVPIRLDGTPLRPPLNEYQAIDYRAAFVHDPPVQQQRQQYQRQQQQQQARDCLDDPIAVTWEDVLELRRVDGEIMRPTLALSGLADFRERELDWILSEHCSTINYDEVLSEHFRYSFRHLAHVLLYRAFGPATPYKPAC